MASSKLFSRCCLFNYHPNRRTQIFRTQTQPIHHHQSNKFPQIPSNLLTKLKDTILVLEATKGPSAKVAIGLCQAGAAAALVFGTGYAFSLVSIDSDPKSVSSTDQLIPINPNGQDLQDAESLIRYLEERKYLIDKRIDITYFHMLTSLLTAGLTSALSFRVFKNKAFLLQIGSRPLVAVGLGVVTPFLMGSLVRSLPRTPNTDGKLFPYGMKEFGHLLYAGSIGLIAAPLYLLGGQSMARAAYVTGGCMVGLHGASKVIPKDAMLDLGTPLMLAVDAVLISFLLTLVLPKTHYAFMPLYRFMMHGGLLIYSANYLYALQKMEKSAMSRQYDPVNAAMSLSMNLLNIFARLSFMLPPYFQLCRDYHVVMPMRQKPSSSSSAPSKSHEPGSNNGGQGGGGNGTDV